jgi:benzoate membrane transport protein
VFGASVAAVFAAFPQKREREPALIAFLMTASGVSLFGIGSAFWGLLTGAAALLLLKPREAT